MNPSSHDAGRVIAKALGGGPSRSTVSAQRNAVVLAMRAAARPAGPPWLKLALAAALVVAPVVLVLLLRRGDDLSASLAGQPLLARTQISVSTAQAVEFSDGSRLALEPHARLQLSQLSAERADVVLHDGRVFASIHKGTGRAWTISAGPFDVRVVGTQFDVRWDPVRQEFGVSVREGKVLVFGGDLPLSGVALESGGRLERRLPPPSSGSTARAVGDAPASASAPEPARLLPRNDAAPAAELDWSKLAKKGQYKRALELADRLGFDRLTRELGENDLLLLANTARFAGNSPRAREALLRLRTRFPRGAAAPVCALYLARIAEDHDKDLSEATNWLSAFLNESPRGGLAADARARLLSILLKQGNRARAREVAADYLKFHPDGAYAAKARSIVDSSK